MRPIREVLEERTGEWMAMPGVVGTAVGQRDGRPCLVVLVAVRTDELAARLPAEVEGYRVVIKESGELRAL